MPRRIAQKINASDIARPGELLGVLNCLDGGENIGDHDNNLKIKKSISLLVQSSVQEIREENTFVPRFRHTA